MLELRLGALAPPIADQVAGQGLTVGDTELFERARTSITFLYVRGLLSDAEKKSAQERLVRAITDAIGSQQSEPPVSS